LDKTCVLRKINYGLWIALAFQMRTRHIFYGVTPASANGWKNYHLHVPTVCKSESLNLLEPLGPVQVVQELFKGNCIAYDYFMFCSCGYSFLACMWSDNKVRELIAVQVLHTSLLNTTVVAFKALLLGSYAPMPAPSPPFKTILELVLWNGLQSCRCSTPVIIKIPSFQFFLIFGNRKKSLGARSGE